MPRGEGRHAMAAAVEGGGGFRGDLAQQECIESASVFHVAFIALWVPSIETIYRNLNSSRGRRGEDRAPAAATPHFL